MLTCHWSIDQLFLTYAWWTNQNLVSIHKAGDYDFAGTDAYIAVKENDVELCKNAGCFASTPPGFSFNALTAWDEYKIVVDVANQRYKVYYNDVVVNNFVNPAPNAAEKEWRYYQGATPLRDITVVLGANGDFGEYISAEFDDVSAEGGECPYYCNQTCLNTTLDAPANAPACENDAELYCCESPDKCVFDGMVLSGDYDPETDDTLNNITPPQNITCEVDTNHGIGIWCPTYFQFDQDSGKCMPYYSTCDYGFENALLNGCDAWWSNDENSGPDYYNIINSDSNQADDCLNEINPWQSTCCLFQDYRDYQLYQWDRDTPNIPDIIVYNP